MGNKDSLYKTYRNLANMFTIFIFTSRFVKSTYFFSTGYIFQDYMYLIFN